MKKPIIIVVVGLLLLLTLAACVGPQGLNGLPGLPGNPGIPGPSGISGSMVTLICPKGDIVGEVTIEEVKGGLQIFVDNEGFISISLEFKDCSGGISSIAIPR